MGGGLLGQRCGAVRNGFQIDLEKVCHLRNPAGLDELGMNRIAHVPFQRSGILEFHGDAECEWVFGADLAVELKPGNPRDVPEPFRCMEKVGFGL
jgi:hypothetical protein